MAETAITTATTDQNPQLKVADKKKTKRHYEVFRGGSTEASAVIKALGLRDRLTVSKKSASSIKKMLEDALYRVVTRANMLRMCGSRNRKILTKKKDANGKEKTKNITINGRGTLQSKEIIRAIRNILSPEVASEFMDEYDDRMNDIKKVLSTRQKRNESIRLTKQLEELKKQKEQAEQAQ